MSSVNSEPNHEGSAKAVIIVLVVIGYLLYSAYTCNDKKDQEVKTVTTESTSSHEQPAIEVHKKIGDRIDVGNFSYVVGAIKYSKAVGNEFTTVKADGIFLLVALGLKNRDNEAHTLNTSMFKLTDQNGVEYEYSVEGSTALEMMGNETLFLKQCNPNIQKKGILIFEVPEKGVYDLHLSGGFWSGATAVVRLAK